MKASKHLPFLLTTDWQREQQVGWVAVSFRLYYLYLILSHHIFSCCQLPFWEFPKHATAFHYRCDMQIYYTFVLFVIEHFPGLLASGTHCIILQANTPIQETYNLNSSSPKGVTFFRSILHDTISNWNIWHLLVRWWMNNEFKGYEEKFSWPYTRYQPTSWR
jgi:hypothetical protein